MPVIRRTAKAEEDLVDIWIYIAHDNPDAADRLLEEIDRKFVLLAENPRLGRARPDIAPEFRHWPVGNYLILYRLVADGIEPHWAAHPSRERPPCPPCTPHLAEVRFGAYSCRDNRPGLLNQFSEMDKEPTIDALHRRPAIKLRLYRQGGPI